MEAFKSARTVRQPRLFLTATTEIEIPTEQSEFDKLFDQAKKMETESSIQKPIENPLKCLLEKANSKSKDQNKLELTSTPPHNPQKARHQSVSKITNLPKIPNQNNPSLRNNPQETSLPALPAVSSSVSPFPNPPKLPPLPLCNKSLPSLRLAGERFLHNLQNDNNGLIYNQTEQTLPTGEIITDQDYEAHKDYIESKFETIIKYFEGLENRQGSFQQFLQRLTSTSLPKYNFFSDWTVRQAWDILQEHYDDIFAEILTRKENLNDKEFHFNILKKKHTKMLQEREFLNERLMDYLLKKKKTESFQETSKKAHNLLAESRDILERQHYDREGASHRRARHLFKKKYEPDWSKIHLTEPETFTKAKPVGLYKRRDYAFDNGLWEKYRPDYKRPLGFVAPRELVKYPLRKKENRLDRPRWVK